MASNKGWFSSLPPEEHRKIAAMGGREVHRQGRGHVFTSETAREAGIKSAQLRAAKRAAAPNQGEQG